MDKKDNSTTSLQASHKNNMICLFSNSFEDALYHHRIAAPLSHAGIKLIHGVENGKIIAGRLIESDLVLMQRDFPRDISVYEEVLNLAHQNKKPVIFDLDDLIFSLQEGHPDRDKQLYSEALLPMFQALMDADLVTVSTPKLKETLSSYNKNIVVLPNYFDDNLWRFQQPEKNTHDDGIVTIAYMGTESHMPDLELISPVLEDLIESYPQKIKLHFWGIEPPSRLKSKALVEWTPVQGYKYKDFVEEFQKLKADIFVAPLVNHLFNQCKSSIKFLEYSALGIPGVFSKIDPYNSVIIHGENGFLASTQEEWRDCLVRLIEDVDLRYTLASKAQQTIKEEWLLSKNYSKWQEAFQLLNASISEHQYRESPSQDLIRSITKQLFEHQERSKEELQKAQTRLEEKGQELNLQIELVQESKKKISDLSSQNEEQQQVIEGQNKSIKEKDDRLEELNVELVEKQGRVSHLEKEISQLIEEKAALQTSLEGINNKYLQSAREQALLNQKIIEKEQEITQLLSHLDVHKQEIVMLHREISGINQELKDIRNSRIYQFSQIIRKLVAGVFPPNSWLVRSVKKVLKLLVTPLLKLTKRSKLKKDLELIRKSPYFDEDYYLANNEDVKQAMDDPAKHYMYFGGFEGRDPGPEFSSNEYRGMYPDVMQSGINPLVHFLKFGINEGRSPKKSIKVNEIDGKEKPEKLQEHDQESPSKAKTLGIAGLIDTKSAYYRAYADLQKLSTGEKSPDYRPISEDGIVVPEDIVKLIAFYLPQFHPFPENDAWWGRGFTEWTNVSKAMPQFVGHNQPRLPGELGFYDLRLYEVQERQIELAKLYGIHGFCFHYYWFAGKRLLEKPLDLFLKHKENSFPFCICWANENWTRRWDGQEDDILISQVHSYENDKHFISDLKPLLMDPRYIKINGQPVIIVYRPSLLKEPQKTSAYWREYCQQNGLGEPYLVAAQTFGVSDPRAFGFDAAVEFPPHNIVYENIKPSMQMVNDDHKGSVYDYREMVAKNIRPEKEKYRVFRTVCPGWDNEPRKPGRGNSFAFSTPKMYRRWLEQTCRAEILSFPKEERMVFVNAWNEWGEGAYLEPDRKFGYAYLQATREALMAAVDFGFFTKEGNRALQPVRRHDTAVIVHIYYTELFDEISEYLKNLQTDFDLFVSLPNSKKEFCNEVLAKFPDALVLITENQGRDIAPFIEIYRSIKNLKYKFILKLHTKKSTHREDGDAWRNDILSKLIGSGDAVRKIKKVLDGKSAAGIIGPKKHVLDHRVYWGFNKDTTLKLAREVGIAGPDDPEFNFVAGSMFWAKPEALSFLDLLPVSKLDFEPEPSPPDGALAHAIERFIGLAVKVAGFSIHEIDQNGVITEPESGDLYPFAQPYPQ